jgi:hypothetical protein
MTIHIDDVIAKLQEIKAKEGNLECCKVGHYGEINEMSAYNISVYRRAYENFKRGGKAKPVVDFCVPDIGPDPD